jgi:hypothetical protein
MNYLVNILDYTRAEVIKGDERVVSYDKTSSCRTVYLFDEFVVKLDNGAEQNATEIDFYENALEPEDAEYFPKLLAHGQINRGDWIDSFIIQERIEIDEFKQATPAQISLCEYLRDKYKLGDLCLAGMVNSTFGTRAYTNHNVTPVGKDSILIWDIGFSDR